jgi:phosphohistidine phosphatase SixA
MEPAVRPTRKIRIRLVPVIGYVAVALGLAWFFQLQATTTIIFVRHAETEGPLTPGADPPLSARGRQRAQLLAEYLSDVDVVASVDAVYATSALRTQQTAAPLVERLGQTLNIEHPELAERFMHRVQRDRKGKITLVIVDADAIAPLIEELHGSKRIPVFGPDDYGEMFVVTIPYYGKVKTLRFHYGNPPAEAADHGGSAPTSFSSPLQAP